MNISQIDEQQIQAEIFEQQQAEIDAMCEYQIIQELQHKPVICNRRWLAHLLDCLAIQKNLHEMSAEEIAINQEVIDKTYADGMAMVLETHSHVWQGPFQPE